MMLYLDAGLCLDDLVRGLKSMSPIQAEWDLTCKRVTKGSVSCFSRMYSVILNVIFY